MFMNIHLQNYKSLINFEVKLTNNSNSIRKLALIYGENGSGKTNFISSFETLSKSINTKFSNKDTSTVDTSDTSNKFDNILLELFPSTKSLIRQVKTIGSTDNMVLQYSFKLNGQKGTYTLETDNDSIVSEKLDFVINKNKTNFFTINKDKVDVNNNIFKKSDYSNELLTLIDKYWGKHSLLAILNYEIKDKNDIYINKVIIKPLLNVISFFDSISFKLSNNNGIGSKFNTTKCHNKVLLHLSNGVVNKTDENDLDKAEIFINQFFTSLYSDIKQAYYKRNNLNETIEYKLYFKKLINDKIIDIDFTLESSGTQALLSMLPFIITSILGGVTIIDEFDNSIHDVLVICILENIAPCLKGQLIITTHNTMLLETELAKDSIYIVN